MIKRVLNILKNRCLLALCVLVLAGCSSDDDSVTVSILSPVSLFDFPGLLGSISTTGDGTGLTAYGQVFWTSSLAEIEQLEFSINDPNTPFDTVTSVSNPHNWQQILSPSPLDMGGNSFNVVAKVNGISFLQFLAITRGTSWMHEVAIQHDGNNGRDRWLVLDIARRALLEVDLSTGLKTVISDSTIPDSTLPLLEPVDFVVDGDRALVVDRGAAAIIAIDLINGARSIISDAATPNTSLPFIEPTAIEIVDNSPADKFVYIADQGERNIIRVNLLAANEGERSLIPNLVSFVAINMPLDLAYHAGVNKLFISDAMVNGVVEIDLSATNPTTIMLEDPEGDDDDIDIDYVAIRKLIVNDNTLYVTDAFPYVLSVDIDSASTTYGDREPLSGAIISGLFYFPNQSNPFVFSEALAFNSNDNHLLVIDNFQGVLVAVGLDEDGDGNSAGHRSYIVGGATNGALVKDNVVVEGDELSYTGRETPLLGALVEYPVDALVGDSVVATLDRINNSIVIIDTASGSRDAIVQHADSPEETNFIDPRAFQLSANGNYYVVDAATDRVLQIPSDASERSVMSDETSAVNFVNPVDSVVFDTTLYVLDAGLMDIVEVNIEDGTRSLMGLGCLTTPSSMLRNADAAVTPTVNELIVVEQSTNALYSIDLLDSSNTCAWLTDYGATVDAIDIALDTRSSDPINYDVLILDAANNAIVPVRVGANLRGVVAAPYIPQNNLADTFVSPVAMGFDSRSEQVFVLDRAIRSIFTVDLLWRNSTSHQPVKFDDVNLATDEVDAQRVIISRGTSLNCDANIAVCN